MSLFTVVYFKMLTNKFRIVWLNSNELLLILLLLLLNHLPGKLRTYSQQQNTVYMYYRYCIIFNITFHLNYL